VQGSLIALVNDRDMARLIACRVNDRDMARRITSHKNMIKLQGSAAPALVSTSNAEMHNGQGALVSTSGTEVLGSAAPALVSTSDTEMHEGQNALPLPVVATASPYALLEGQHLAPVVQAAPSSSLVLPPCCFVVTCKNSSMYGKKMRDVHMAGFSVQSNAVIRFRRSDGKVVVVDLLVAIGRYSRTDKGQDAMLKLIERNDEMVKDLLSIQVDKSLTDMVSTYFLIKIFKPNFVPDPGRGVRTKFYSTFFLVQNQI